MSDQNKFINTYIDNAIGLIHEQVTNILHLKTQLKLSQDALAGKDAEIEALNSKIVELEDIIKQKDEQVNKTSVDEKEYQRAISNANSWKTSYDAMVNKVSHMDTLLKQISDMKNRIKDKDYELSQKDIEIERLKIEANSVSKKTSVKKSSTKKEINKTEDKPVLIDLIDKNDSNKDDF